MILQGLRFGVDGIRPPPPVFLAFIVISSPQPHPTPTSINKKYNPINGNDISLISLSIPGN